jgi:FkbM family methyltransferase
MLEPPNVKKTASIILFGDNTADKLRLLVLLIMLRIQKFNISFKINASIDKIVSNICQNVIVNVDGIKYNLIDEESLWIAINYERFIIPWFKPSQGQVVLDIGAHIGKYTLKTAKSVGAEGKVIAVEGNPNNFRILKKNVELNNLHNVLLLNLVAWNKECILRLFNGKCAGWNSAKIDWNLGWYEVNARPLDRVIEECGVDRVDLIKIDVEGAEWEVLVSIKETISKSKPKIVVELSNENSEKVRRLMRELDYGLVRVSEIFNSPIYGVRSNFAYFVCLPLSRSIGQEQH